MKIFSQAIIFAFFTLFFSSCGSETTKSDVVETVVQEETKNWEEFTISALGNTMQEMKFSEKSITVKEGSWIRIILKNEGIDPSMIHNIIFVNYGKRKDVALKANEVGPDSDFIPKNHPDFIAASPLALPGETVTFEFKAPAKDNYEFFCSYPGHADMMKGYLFVK